MTDLPVQCSLSLTKLAHEVTFHSAINLIVIVRHAAASHGFSQKVTSHVMFSDVWLLIGKWLYPHTWNWNEFPLKN
ncbi:hypothetical protein X975_17387, partial [Stegodyphus mimosarum]